MDRVKMTIKKSETIIHIYDYIRCNCPHCDLEYNVKILSTEDNFKVRCCECKKTFVASREIILETENKEQNSNFCDESCRNFGYMCNINELWKECNKFTANHNNR